MSKWTCQIQEAALHPIQQKTSSHVGRVTVSKMFDIPHSEILMLSCSWPFVSFCILFYELTITNSQCLLQPLKCPSCHVARCARQTAGTPLAEPWTATAWNRIASVFLSRYTCKVQTYTYLIIFTSFYRYACAWRCIKTGACPNQSETCNRPNGQRLVWVYKNLLYRLYPVWIITPLGWGLWRLHIRIWPIRIWHGCRTKR